MSSKHYSRLFYISLIISIILSAYLVVKERQAFFPDERIQLVSEQYARFFEDNAIGVEESIFELKNRIDTLNSSPLDSKQLVDVLMDELNSNSNILSFLILEHNEKLIMLEKDQGMYLFAIDSSQTTDVVQWHRIDKQQELKNSWTRALGIELDIFKWGNEVFNESYQYQIPIWTSAGRLLETRRNVIACHFSWRNEQTNKLITTVALINNFGDFAVLPLSSDPHFKTFIINANDAVIAFNRSILSEDTLATSFDIVAIDSWNASGKTISSTFNFSYNTDDWWAYSSPSAAMGIKAIMLIIEENTLRFSGIGTNWLELLLILLFLALAFLFYWMKFRSRKTIKTYIRQQNSDRHASELIGQGEGNYLEYKSSFRYDYQQQKVNKDLEFVIAKSIAAFSNGRGGTLLIGVDDEGNVLGLENDIFSLKRKDIDFFENFLRTFLNKVFSVGFVSSNLKIHFPVVDQKIICRIDVKAGQEPVFVEITKNNQKSERFYLRSGNTSMEIKSLTEINKYTRQRFG
jgi:hypothetical protein